MNQNEDKICIHRDLTFRFTWGGPTFYSLGKCISSSNDYSVHRCINIKKNFTLKTGNIASTAQRQLFLIHEFKLMESQHGKKIPFFNYIARKTQQSGFF